MIIDILSDLHGSFPKLDGGDLLILGGDYTRRHTTKEFLEFRDWLQSLDYDKKIVIGGNHDTGIYDGHWHDGYFSFNDAWLGATYLSDSGCEYAGLKFCGSPWTAEFEGMNPRCKAWTLRDDEALSKKWALIPDDTDILITHSPPFGILDMCLNPAGDKYENVGSLSLLSRVKLIRPKLHIFGHIHEGYGQVEQDGTKFINASHMDGNYMPVNKPVRVVI